MPVYKGTKEANDIYYGELEIKEVRLGETLKYVANQIIDLGTGTSFNIANIYPKYAELTDSNFFCTTMNRSTGSDRVTGDNVTYQYVHIMADFYKSYNATSGVLTMFNGCGSDTNILALNKGAVHAFLITKPRKLKYLGQGTRFDVSNIEGYQYFTADNFLIGNIPLHRSIDHIVLRSGTSLSNSASGEASFTRSYNPSTGIYTCVWNTNASDDYGASQSYNVAPYVYLNPKVG